VSVPSSPFVGLAAFTPRMAAYFTGRERFALTLAGAVLRSRVTVMYGQSGSGKSSVLGAAFPQVIRATLHDADEAVLDPPFRRFISGAGTWASKLGYFMPPQRSSRLPLTVASRPPSPAGARIETRRRR